MRGGREVADQNVSIVLSDNLVKAAVSSTCLARQFLCNGITLIYYIKVAGKSEH